MSQSETIPSHKLALALSGGGSRAIAFHLGSLRALHRTGLLDDVATISCVSGGSVIGSLYCSEPGTFSDFETKVRQILAEGFVRPSIWIAFSTLEGLKALVVAALLFIDRSVANVLLAIIAVASQKSPTKKGWPNTSRFKRSASRTTILMRAFSRVFKGRTLGDLRRDRPKLIIVACELTGQSAFYFSSDILGSWRYGQTNSSSYPIARAVAASASYPAVLPALDEQMTLVKNGIAIERRVSLTDGGVYDNLGLAPLWPGRATGISLHVASYDRIIACRAGYSIKEGLPPVFLPSRMKAVAETIMARNQNLATTRLFDLQKSGQITGVLLPYLGQDDERLKYRPVDFVTRKCTMDYPTDFKGMSNEWVDKLVRRGEQLTLALLQEHGWV